MVRFGEPFRLYTVYDQNTPARLGRYRRKKEALDRAKELRASGHEVRVISSRYWYVDIRRTGYRNTVRCTEAQTLDEAKMVVDSWRIQFRQDEERKCTEESPSHLQNPYGPPVPGWQPMTFQEAVEAFLESKDLEEITPKTMGQYRQIFEQRLIPEFHPKFLHEIKHEDVERYFKRRRRPTRSGKTPSADLLRRERSLLRQLYKMATVRRHAAHDPTAGIKIPRSFPRMKRILDAEEVSALLKACKDPYKTEIRALRNSGGRQGGRVTETASVFTQTFSPPPWLYDIVVLALSTSLRLGNLVDLRWKHVDLKRRQINLPPATMKNRDSLTVFLNDDAQKVLERRRGRHRVRVFPSLDNRTVQKSFRKAVARAKIKPCCFHDLRKTCASWLADAGVNLNAVMAITGHKTLNVALRHYLAVTDDQRRAAIKKIRLPAV